VTHRIVRVMPELYRQLEAQLPTERGPRGEPTVAEFAASDLLDIVDIFAEQWDDLLKGIPGRSDYRDLWFDSRLVYGVVVRASSPPSTGRSSWSTSSSTCMGRNSATPTRTSTTTDPHLMPAG
jgi:hypothetical protein